MEIKKNILVESSKSENDETDPMITEFSREIQFRSFLRVAVRTVNGMDICPMDRVRLLARLINMYLQNSLFRNFIERTIAENRNEQN